MINTPRPMKHFGPYGADPGDLLQIEIKRERFHAENNILNRQSTEGKQVMGPPIIVHVSKKNQPSHRMPLMGAYRVLNAMRCLKKLPVFP